MRLQHAHVLELAEGPRHCLDRQTQIVSNVPPCHRQFDFIVAGAAQVLVALAAFLQGREVLSGDVVGRRLGAVALERGAEVVDVLEIGGAVALDGRPAVGGELDEPVVLEEAQRLSGS